MLYTLHSNPDLITERKLNIREARKEKAKLKERLLARFKKDFLGVQDTSRDMHYNRSSVQVSLLVNQRKEEQFQRSQSRRSAAKIPVENTSQSDTVLEEADDKLQSSKLKLSPTIPQEGGLDTHNEKNEDLNKKSEEEKVETNQEVPKTELHIIDEQQTQPQPDDKGGETVLPVVETEQKNENILKKQEPQAANTDQQIIHDTGSSDDIENIKSTQSSPDGSGSVRKRNSNESSARSSPSRSHKVHPID